MTTKPFRLSLKVLVYNDQGQCLVIQRSLKSKGNPGGWNINGRKIELGKDFKW